MFTFNQLNLSIVLRRSISSKRKKMLVKHVVFYAKDLIKKVVVNKI